MTKKTSNRSHTIDYGKVIDEFEQMSGTAPVIKSAYLANAIEQDMGDGQGVWSQEFKAWIDSMTLKGLFFSEDWVFILVDIIGQKLSQVPMRVMQGRVENGEFKKEPIEGHPLQLLIDNPNALQSYEAWVYCAIVDLIMLGNAIQWYAPGMNQLMMLPAETVQLRLNKDGAVESYDVVEFLDSNQEINKARVTKFAIEDIIHMRRPNPSSMLWGLSPFIPGRKSVLFNRYSQDYLNSFYQKGAIPGFALEMSADANERVAMRLLRTFENAYTGRKNMRRTMMLPKGVSLKEVSHTLANQELKDYINQNRETLINILKVPKHELSLQESGSLGSEEAKTALKNFWYSTLIPTGNLFTGEQTRFFRRRGMLSDMQFIEFDLSNVEVLQEDLVAKADLAKKMLESGWSVNEVRQKVWKLEPTQAPGANEPFILKPAASPFGGGGGFLGMPSPVPQPAPYAEPKDAVPESTVSGHPKAAKDRVSAFLKSGDGWFTRREAKIREDAQKGITEMEKATIKMFSDMAVTIIKTVRSHLREKGWDDIRTKADERSKLVRPAELKRRLRSALDKFEERWVDENRKALSARMDVGFDVALELPFNLPSRNEIAAAKVRSEAIRQDALEERSGRVFQYMSETTIGKVFNSIEKGIDEGKTVQQIADDLRNRFANIEEIGSRAMTIARTETLTAVSLGQASAMKEASRLIPNLKKMWISADDDRVRDSHERLHGDVVSADAEFDNGLKFPRDPSGPAEEVINCRCTWIMVPADQMQNIDDSLTADEET